MEIPLNPRRKIIAERQKITVDLPLTSGQLGIFKRLMETGVVPAETDEEFQDLAEYEWIGSGLLEYF